MKQNTQNWRVPTLYRDKMLRLLTRQATAITSLTVDWVDVLAQATTGTHREVLMHRPRCSCNSFRCCCKHRHTRTRTHTHTQR